MNLKQVEKWMTTWWGMWLFFFVYTAAVAAIIQLVLLPHFLTRMNYGHGLFVQDSAKFHRVALQQASDMMKYGWSAWQLSPGPKGYPAGLASIFYYLWYPEPFSMIPANAVLHATAGCVVFFILSSFLHFDRTAAFGGAALFVLNPASLEWASQIHRDGTFILGNLLVLSAWLLIMKGIKEEKWRFFICAGLAFVPGTTLIWASRNYWGQVVAVVCAVLIAVIFFHMIVSLHRRSSRVIYHIAAVLLLCIMLVTQTALLDKFAEGTVRQWDEAAEMIAKKGQQHEIEWRFSSIMPRYIESKLYILAQVRWGVSATGGGSVIDPEVNFESSEDYLLYLPRALEVGFLSPFPSMWFSPGTTPATTAGRAVLGILTMFFYICIAFFVRSLLICRKNRSFWLVVLYSICGVLVFAYTYPNIGTLNRFRYCFYMTIVSIGFTSAIQDFTRWRQTDRSATAENRVLEN